MKYYLYLIVAIAGACVLALEILGTRILGPFYGVSIYLWSALISVTLAALSAGYAVGGNLADRRKNSSDLSYILLGSGAWTMVIPLLKHPILSITEPLGLRFAVLFAAIILFFPPLFLLGMVSPLAIKLKTKGLENVGRSAGNLYAVSTLASVFAALATGFFLVPYFGVVQMTELLGAILIITGVISLLKFKKTQGWIASIFFAILIVLANSFITDPKPNPKAGILFVKESPYGKIEVRQQEGWRYLLIDGGIHSIENIETDETMMSYAIVLDILKLAFPAPGKLLLIGLGGGSVAKSFYLDNWQVDAVEIDPVVIQAAKKYFRMNDEIAHIYAGDGRRFLTKSNDHYDLIILDAFGSSSIPFHLITQESFQKTAAHLASNGILAMNVESVGWNSPLVRSVSRTLKRVFDEVVVFPLEEPPNVLGNLIILAANRKIDIDEEFLGNPVDYADLGPVEHWRVVEKNHAWDNRFFADTTDALLLTDNKNPVDIWSERTNLAYRKEIEGYFLSQ